MLRKPFNNGSRRALALPALLSLFGCMLPNSARQKCPLDARSYLRNLNPPATRADLWQQEGRLLALY